MHRWAIRSRLFVAATVAIGVVSIGCGNAVGPADGAADGAADLAADQSVSPDTVDAPDTSMDTANEVAAEVSVDVPADVSSACPYMTVRALTLPMDTAMGTLSGMSRNPSTTCTTMSGTAGPDDFYTLHVTSRTGVILSTDSMIDTMLAIRRTCDQPLTEVACNNDRGAMTRNAFIRTILEPGDYTILVDQIGFGVGGAYTLTLQSFVPPDNASCSMARLLPSGSHLIGQDTGSAATSNTACLPAATGLVLYYAVSIPARNQLLATATPTGAFDPAIRVLTSCTAMTCLASASTAGAGTPEILSYINTTDSPVSVVIAVGGANDTLGVFALDIELRPPPSNAVCAMATPVMDGTALMGQESTLGRDTVTACLAADVGVVRYYSATVPAGRILRVAATRTAGAGSAVVRVMTSCTATSCLASGEGAGTAVVRFANTTAAPQNVIVAVGSSTATSITYDLAVSILNAAANASCATPTVVTSGTRLTGQDTGLGADVSASCLPSLAGPGLYYSVTVPANNRLVAVATRTGASRAWNPVVRLVTNCAATSCLGQAVADPLGVAALVFNNGAAPQTLVFSVGSDTVSSTGTFDLSVTLQPPAVNAICSTATVVTDGTVIRGENSADARDTVTGCFSPPFSALYYRATIPAGNRLTAVATSTGMSFGTAVQIVSDCMSTTCLNPPTRPGPGSTITGYVNAGATPQTVIIQVGPIGPPGVMATWDLSITIRPPPANANCTTPTPVMDGTILRGENPDDARTATISCGGFPSFPALFYSATVPAGQRLIATASPTPGGSAPNLQIVASCGATSCLAGPGRSGPGGTTISYANSGATAQTVIIEAGVLSGGPPSTPYDLSIAIRPPALNAACATPLALTSGTPAIAQDIGEATSVVAACLPMFSGPSLFYSISIPAGQTLTAVARLTAPTTPWTPVLRLLSACGAATCLASSSSGGALSYTNSTASAQTVIIAVGSDFPGAGGLFDLTAIAATAPFVETMIPTACDDMTTASVLALTGDDVASAVIAAPFSFQFFGETVTHFSLSTNGFMQVFPSAVGMPRADLGVPPLPNPMAPPRLIAAFLDDLFVDPLASIRLRTVGTAPNRHGTAQWTNVTFCCGGGGPQRMTFQIQLYETSNVIEMHYCALAPAGDPRVTGGNATIGVQDALGVRGYVHSARTPLSVSTVNAIRLTPGT